MVLYAHCEGVISERPTIGEAHPGYALVEGLGVPFINIPAHYAFRVNAEEAARCYANHSVRMTACNPRRKAAA
jgi:hypothetical protein